MCIRDSNKTVLVYMIAFFFYIDGVHTVISMATSYGSALGIDSTQLVLALLDVYKRQLLAWLSWLSPIPAKSNA